MARKKTSASGADASKFKQTANKVIGGGKQAISGGKKAVKPIGKRGKTPVGKRSK